MFPRIPTLVVLASAVPTASPAEDFCAALTNALTWTTEAWNDASEASDSVSALRRRLSEDPRRYGGDVEDLGYPSGDAATATNQLATAVRDLTELKRIRCPDIPDGL